MRQVARNVRPREKVQESSIRDRVMPAFLPFPIVVIYDNVREQFDYLDDFTPCPNFLNDDALYM
jgi:hypothetical protein